MLKKIWHFLNSYKADLIIGFVGMLCSAVFLGSLAERGTIDPASVFGGALFIIGLDCWDHGVDGFFRRKKSTGDGTRSDEGHVG